MVLLDTDIMIDLLREYPPAVSWLGSLEEEDVILPGFVVMELIQGCPNKAEQTQLESALEPYGVIWPLPEICQEASTTFSTYHLSHGLGILDALIGQIAVALGLPLHTFNQKHYQIIPELQTLQPYRKP